MNFPPPPVLPPDLNLKPIPESMQIPIPLACEMWKLLHAKLSNRIWMDVNQDPADNPEEKFYRVLTGYLTGIATVPVVVQEKATNTPFRYLVYPIDKHQSSPQFTNIPDNDKLSADNSLTVIVDLKEGTRYFRGKWEPVQTCFYNV